MSVVITVLYYLLLIFQRLNYCFSRVSFGLIHFEWTHSLVKVKTEWTRLHRFRVYNFFYDLHCLDFDSDFFDFHLTLPCYYFCKHLWISAYHRCLNYRNVLNIFFFLMKNEPIDLVLWFFFLLFINYFSYFLNRLFMLYFVKSIHYSMCVKLRKVNILEALILVTVESLEFLLFHVDNMNLAIIQLFKLFQYDIITISLLGIFNA